MLRHGETMVGAPKILSLLAEKHSEDTFVSECKVGPSVSKSSQRLDAWAMRNSWSNASCIGYEIKVSRSDFLGDDKWRGYLPFCNEFWFVCPAGLISVDELPSDVGLMYVSSTGTKLFTKKKAVFRDIQIPDSIFRYILMWRARIGGKKEQKFDWDEWREQKAIDRDLGRANSRAVRETLNERVQLVKDENNRLTARMQSYDGLRVLLKEIGCDPDRLGYYHLRIVRDKIKDLSRIVSPELRGALERVSRGAAEALQYIKAEEEGKCDTSSQ